jgi:hypothetical protein
MAGMKYIEAFLQAFLKWWDQIFDKAKAKKYFEQINMVEWEKF